MALFNKFSGSTVTLQVWAQIPNYGPHEVSITIDRDFTIAINGKAVQVCVKDWNICDKTVLIKRNDIGETTNIKYSTFLQLWKSRVPADVTEWACSP